MREHGTQHPKTSWVGIGLAAFTAPTMPLLAAAKRRVGRKLNSSATVSEAAQNQICAYLSVALLAGLLANALAGWWWADPAAALVIGALGERRARQLARQALRLLLNAAQLTAERSSIELSRRGEVLLGSAADLAGRRQQRAATRPLAA